VPLRPASLDSSLRWGPWLLVRKAAVMKSARLSKPGGDFEIVAAQLRPTLGNPHRQQWVTNRFGK
jgi:hypothetical protein